MSEAPQLEIVELGDAMEETKGLSEGILGEVNEAAPYVKP